jgi:DNA mismatch repair protein MutL
VEVHSLFFNVPARRKFLKSARTELRRCLEVIQGYALAFPQVRFRLEHEGRSLLDARSGKPGEEGLRERIAQVFGQGFAQSLCALPSTMLEGGEKVSGFVGSPEEGRSRRSFVFINGRLIRDRAIAAVFYRSIRDEWRSEAYPPLFLVLSMDPGKLDVNVHPQKSEVRFRDAGFLHRLGDVLRQGLQNARREGVAPARVHEEMPLSRPSWEGLGAPREWRERSSLEVRERAEKLAEVSYQQAKPRRVPLSGAGRGTPGSLRLLGQYKGSLILMEAPDGLVLLDQHAAHERILYEELKAHLERAEPAAQGILTPVLLELAPAEAMKLAEIQDGLAELGFGLEALSGNDVALTAVPSVLTIEEGRATVMGLVSEGEGGGGTSQESLKERLLEAVTAGTACRSAVKIHRYLSQDEMESLVSRLFRCEQPHSCPHGRPTMLKMTDADLERRFGRSG